MAAVSQTPIRRADLLGRIVDEVVGGRVLSLQGVGGAGKSVLARQVADDRRVRDAFPGGVFWVPVGEHADPEQVAVTLYRQASGGRHHGSVMSALSQLADRFRERAGLVLVVFDDVWPPADTIDELVGAVGPNVSVLYTARNVSLRLQPVGGFAAETGAAITLFYASHVGIPVSTTHTITGSIGVGTARRMSAVRWGVASRVVMAWIITIPGAALIAAVTSLFVKALT